MSSGRREASAGAAPELRVRSAATDDVPLLHRLIVELAVYEREPDAVKGTEEMLAGALFGPHRSAEALIAEIGAEPVGFAIFCGSFSTWEALPGIWLEDLYVSEHHRGSGAGRALLARLAGLAIERGCARLEWNVLDWNEPALRFYKRIGAEPMPAWRLHRLTGESLRRVASGP